MAHVVRGPVKNARGAWGAVSSLRCGVPFPGSAALAGGASGIDRAFRMRMSQPKRLRCYEYVNRPYDSVRTLLHGAPLELLNRATASAGARAKEVAGSLQIALAGVELGVKVKIRVHSVEDGEGVAGLSPVTRVTLGWEAEHAPSLFPLMSARLSAWPLTSTETQIELEGDYTPPFGPLGKVVDAAIGHRIAEASVRRFVEEVVEQVRNELPATVSA
jgi:hypothetical protein